MKLLGRPRHKLLCDSLRSSKPPPCGSLPWRDKHHRSPWPRGGDQSSKQTQRGRRGRNPWAQIATKKSFSPGKEAYQGQDQEWVRVPLPKLTSGQVNSITSKPRTAGWIWKLYVPVSLGPSKVWNRPNPAFLPPMATRRPQSSRLQ